MSSRVPATQKPGCDLAELAGLQRASVIVEIMNEDGSMARLKDLQQFAALHNLKIGTIRDLITYQLHHSKMLEKLQSMRLTTKYGEFQATVFQDNITKLEHLALVCGTPQPEEPCLVRVHGLNRLRDILLEDEQAFSWSLGSALEYIQNAGTGLVILLNTGESNEFSQEVHKMQLSGSPQTAEKPLKYTIYDVGLGAQILNQLEVRNLRILGAPANYKSLSAYGIEILEYIQFQDVSPRL